MQQVYRANARQAYVVEVYTALEFEQCYGYTSWFSRQCSLEVGSLEDVIIIVFGVLKQWLVSLIVHWLQAYVCQNYYRQDQHSCFTSTIAAPSNEKQPTWDPNIVEFVNLPDIYTVSRTPDQNSWRLLCQILTDCRTSFTKFSIFPAVREFWKLIMICDLWSVSVGAS